MQIKVVGPISGMEHGEFFVSMTTTDPATVRYLHKDGTWHASTANPTTGQFAGWFQTRESAQSVLAVYPQ